LSDDTALVPETGQPEEPDTTASPREISDSSAQPTSDADEPSKQTADAAEPEDHSPNEYMLGDQLVRLREEVKLVWGSPTWSDALGKLPADPAAAGISQGHPEGRKEPFECREATEMVDVEPNPAGDRIAEDNDGLSHFEKWRRNNYKKTEDIQDVTKEHADNLHDLLGPPPTGHAEATTTPEVSRAPYEGVNAGDTAMAMLVAGAMIGETVRWIYGKLEQRKKKES
jgi:hypothetical protein